MIQVSLIRIKTRRYNICERPCIAELQDRNPERDGIKPKGTLVGKRPCIPGLPINHIFFGGVGGRYSFSTAHVVLNLIKPHVPGPSLATTSRRYNMNHFKVFETFL